jgi:hypothetical protein
MNCPKTVFELLTTHLSVEGGNGLIAKLVGVSDLGGNVKLEHGPEVLKTSIDGEVVVDQGAGVLERLEGIVVGRKGSDANDRVVELDAGRSEESRQSPQDVNLERRKQKARTVRRGLSNKISRSRTL